MSHTNYLNSLKQDGYFIYHNAINNIEVNQLRNTCQTLYEKESCDTMPWSLFSHGNFLPDTLFSHSMKGILSEIFGVDKKIYFFPNFTVRNNLYINWHTDDFFLKTPFDPMDVLPSLYLFNIYLQDNSREYGGGLDVQKGSHRLPGVDKKTLIQETQPSYQHTLFTHAGDLVVFDYRVVHRGTLPEKTDATVPRLALQWVISTSDAIAPIYLTYLRERATRKIHLSDFTHHRASKFFNELPLVTQQRVAKQLSIPFFDDKYRLITFSDYLP
ncbi:phytanoyl-CoA dioxygenase family protein [Salmonella enterica]|uniref:phytanoyl-CoA dioxygenase family protein n=1 Tax=Salmonella enterica TaxID=28901 RepID=UPI001C46296E|nr:phytanoyl-CoA dioxygenase family protein [Salmonella enterica]